MSAFSLRTGVRVPLCWVKSVFPRGAACWNGLTARGEGGYLEMCVRLGVNGVWRGAKNFCQRMKT